MRIITGKFKGASLYTVPGMTTRPTTDYNRELIFSVYQEYAGVKVLDLYAGTGSFGLEALSRGAEYVDFVEFSTKALTTLFQNIEKLRCGDDCHVHRRRVEQYIKDCETQYDVIFLDPPYNKDMVNRTVSAILSRELLKPEGLIIVEHARAEALDIAFKPHIITDKPGKVTCFSILQPHSSQI
ncbi:MAG: 16S rRNA (guanine(966)-N(2))-methyltransferase RsmD [Candidatus Cloacimonetes bacterium HGW-Cloacimonetes-1]|jgi:16S rRNA (guanine966-N2)-methyltransferase|nr:MAG: 16S rRNA (guanine(966)-N(2))-methyltransferase RsmD [Candidatus Cloacimonetes bacterium HGW-Cloacimonetes-1]